MRVIRAEKLNFKMKLLSVCTFFLVLVEVLPKVRDTSLSLLARRKRTLIFQEGINWVQMVVGIGFPVELQQESVTWGATVKSYYLLPTNSNQFLNPSTVFARKKRSGSSRWEIYSLVKSFMDTFNIGNGKPCLLRAICEAALIPFDQKTGLLAEVMHVVLTPSSTNEEVLNNSDFEYHAAEKLGKDFSNCKRLFPECDFRFLEKLTQIFL